MSYPEDVLEAQLGDLGLDAVREYHFGAEACGGAGKGLRERLKKSGLKNWRADFAILDYLLLIEIEGGGWTGGRHTRPKGFAEDLLKYDAAMRLGYTVYRCSPEMVMSNRAIETISKIISLYGGIEDPEPG